MRSKNATSTLLHASCVGLNGFGVLIVGSAGSGKSSLALRLMALNATLISDDKTHIKLSQNQLIGAAPHSIKGRIEAYGVGILRAKTVGSAIISLVVDMSIIEKHRLPPKRRYNLLGQSVALLHKVEADYFPSAILQIAKSGGLTQFD